MTVAGAAVPLDIENVYDQIGGFGRFQLFAFISVVYAEIPVALTMLISVYVGRVPEDWICTTEGADGAPGFNMTISSKDVCGCNGTLRGDDSTIVGQWNLVCSKAWIPDFITSVHMLGVTIGSLLGSFVGDRYGRKACNFGSALVIMVAGLCSSLATEPIFYGFCRFVIGAAVTSMAMMVAMYPMEFFPTKWRSICGTVGPWGEGVMLLALLAYCFPSWRTLTCAASLFAGLIFLSFPFLPESPRFLINKGRTKEATRVFDQIARWNGVSNRIPVETVEKLVKIQQARSGGEEVSTNLDKPKTSSSGYLELAQSGPFRVQIIVLSLIWFSVTLISYGISFGITDIGGNIYINVIILGGIDSIAYPGAKLVMDWLGRRRALLMYISIGSIPLVAIIVKECFMTLGTPWYAESFIVTSPILSLRWLSLSAQFFMAGAWSTLRCFTPESFPTSMRSSAQAVAYVSAGLGGILAPQMLFLSKFYEAMPYFIFGTFGLLSVGASFFLRETKGLPMPENTNITNYTVYDETNLSGHEMT